MDKLLVTPEEAAKVLSIGRSKVYELMASGKLTSVRIGTSRRVPVKALSEFVEALGPPTSPDDEQADGAEVGGEPIDEGKHEKPQRRH